jgi:hypothetical protein
MKRVSLCQHTALTMGLAFYLVLMTAGAEERSPWRIDVPRHGEARGETTVEVAFPSPGARMPVTFGIPLGQAQSPGHVVVLDGHGKNIPADVTALGNWDHAPARWALVSCVVDGSSADSRVPLTLRWGDPGPEYESTLHVSVDEDSVVVTNAHYFMRLSSAGIESLEYSGRLLKTDSWQPAFVTREGRELRPTSGKLLRLYDGPIHQSLRFVSHLSDALELHQEYDFHADSPVVRCRMRYVNRSVEDISLRQIVPVEIVGLSAIDRVKTGLSEGGNVMEAATASVVQEAFGWRAVVGDARAEGKADTLGEWLMLTSPQRERGFMLVFPHFQEMAAGERTAFSEMAFGDEKFQLRHYVALPGKTPDIRLRETMARTFEYWIVADVEPGQEAAMARAVKQQPYVVYDRAHLTAMGVFPEKQVSRLFDEEVLEAARYFKRAQVPRIEFPRCSRGADPGPDKSGEGFYEVDLHAGGMVYGEVFQYFEPTPPEVLRKQYHQELGIPLEHIVTGGKCTYRNGDIVLALYQQYLRSGDATLAQFAPIHASVFADVSVSHAPASNGLGHYYCDWYSNPYVYQRFEGLLLAALVTGDPWWMETATAMADYCVSGWKDGFPRDGGLTGGLHGVQLRSPYIAKMLLEMHALTGEQKYADTAARLAEWLMPLQEPEGWWRDTPNATREYRNSPIFAGYSCMGLWPLYKATGNERLGATLLKAADYQVSMQEDPTGRNPGTFPNSYWYRVKEGSQSTTPIPDTIVIEGNYAVTSHWANIIFQAFLETGDLDYFYSANAAWVNVLNHRTPEGGVPLSNGRDASVWSHVMVECLPNFAAVAEEQSLPIVMGSWVNAELDCFMGKGATYQDGDFAFGMKYRHDAPLSVRVYFPAGKPQSVTLDEETMPFEYDATRKVATFRLPPATEYRAARVMMRASTGR